MPDYLDNHKRSVGFFIFIGAFFLRSLLNLIFFIDKGWFSSHLIEIWYYYGVAEKTFSLSPLDPTFAVLRLIGWLFPIDISYQAVSFAAALISALTALLIFWWLDYCYDRRSACWGGIIFALLPAPLTLSLVNFSHDIVQVPLLVLFFWTTCFLFNGEGERPVKLCAWLAVVLLIICGLSVGPLMAAAVLIVCFCLIQRIAFPGIAFKKGIFRLPVFLTALAAVNIVLFFIMKAHLLEWAAPLAERFRGIDLASQIRIRVGDLQPLPADAFWNRYTLFVFFLPWGVWTAFRKRSVFIFSLFFFSLALALVVNRGARILDLAVVVCAAVGIRSWDKIACRITLIWIGLFAAVNLFFRPLAEKLCLAIPYGPVPLFQAFRGLIRGSAAGPENTMSAVFIVFAGFFIGGVVLAVVLNTRKKYLLIGSVVALLILQGSWVLIAARTSSDQIEYEAYRWLDEHSAPGEIVFAAWNQGYFIETVTDLRSLTSASRIDFPLYRVYWMEEEAAIRELARRGVDYLHVNSRYFGITSVDRAADRFRMRGNTIIGPPPHHIRSFKRMSRTLLYKMLYNPRGLQRLKLIYEKADPGIGVRIFRLEKGETE